MNDDTRIRRDNERDTIALARLYAREDSDRGFLARQILRLLNEKPKEDSNTGSEPSE